MHGGVTKKQAHLYKQSFGGDTFNTALYFARLTHSEQFETSYFTGLGRDPFSTNMLDSWEKEHINIRSVFISETKLPGLYSISTTSTDERIFQYWRNDSAARYWLLEMEQSQINEALSANQWIYLSGISLAILPSAALEKLLVALRVCKTQGCNIAFDNNYRPKLWRSKQDAYRQVLELTTIAFLTDDDEKMLYGDSDIQLIIDRTQSFGVSEIVIKQGANPCLVVTEHEQIAVAASVVENVVDTTAAGDWLPC